MRGDLTRSSTMLVVEKVVGLVATLLITPFLIRALGTNDYGLWILILSVLGWFSVLDLGLPLAVQRYITIALEKGDSRTVNTVFSTSMMLFTSIGVLAVLGMLLLAEFPQFLGVSIEDHPTVSMALTFLSVKVLWDFMMNAFHGFFAGLLRFDIDANISSLNNITKSLMILTFVPALNIKGAVYATILADVLSNLLKIYYSKRLYQPLRFGLSFVKVSEIRRLFHFSKHVVAIGIARTLNVKSAPFIIAQILDLRSVALYSIADRLVAHAQSFALSISITFGPLFTKKVARGESVNQLFANVSSINMFAVSAIFLPLLALGSSFIGIWVGVDFAAAYPIVVILVLVLICRFVSVSVRQVLLAQENHQLLSVVQLIGAILNISFSIVLAKKYGLIGIALGSAIGAVTADVLLSLVLLKHYNDFKVTPVLRTLVVTIVITFGAGLALNKVFALIVIDQWQSIILFGALVTPFSVGVLFLTVLPRRLQQVFASTVVNRLRATLR